MIAYQLKNRLKVLKLTPLHGKLCFKGTDKQWHEVESADRAFEVADTVGLRDLI